MGGAFGLHSGGGIDPLAHPSGDTYRQVSGCNIQVEGCLVLSLTPTQLRTPEAGGMGGGPSGFTQAVRLTLSLTRVETPTAILYTSSVPVPVISIVGIGGIGKTTLVRMVFNDVRVKEHFEGNTWWVCATEKPEAREMARRILEVITKESIPNLQLSILCEQLIANFSKKFLLVLDDIWDLDWWGQLEATIVNAASGSGILMTTRKKEVSDEIKATYVHEPKCLPFEHSWSLFLSKTLREGETACSLEGVIDIAKSIVRKCWGSPLVVQAVGRVM
ncbi:putative disease resistance protein [Nymphaea thermarum]|nr:putative disease resistance protein [Nymphaea thermarum]